MLTAIIGTIICALFGIWCKIEEIDQNRASEECENTDWNEFYANMG